MSHPSCEDPAFRHPDTPKRAGDTSDQLWRRGASVSGEPARLGGADCGSPALRHSSEQRATSAASAPLTPRSGTSGSSSSGGGSATPVHVNPFECDDMMTSLSLPTSSPSLFERVHSPNKEEPGLEIEHRAQLFPAHIELTPSTYHKQLMAQSYDPHKEIQVQTAIERFFNSEKIVPSPWGSANAQRRAVPVGCQQESPLVAAGRGPLLRHCATQTELTLPACLPPELERALAPYMRGVSDAGDAAAPAGDRSSSPQEDDSMLSNSTLRRKLLFHNADAAEMDSADVSMAEQDTSAYHFPNSPNRGHLVPTSPLSPGGPRASVQIRPDVESPPVSPIAKSMLDSPSTSSIKSQGLARIRYPDDSAEPSDASGDEEEEVCVGGEQVDIPDDSLAVGDFSAPQDTGYHSTLTSLPSLSARHLAAASESSHLARLLGSESASLLASTRLDEASVLVPPAEEGAHTRPPVPIGSSTPSRSQRR